MIIQVINSQLYSNPYQRLLYSALEGRYIPVKGDAPFAAAELQRAKRGIFHIHWEEAIFRGCADRQAGRNKLRRFLQELHKYRDAGGKIVWTVHNAIPHDKGHWSSFSELRRQLGQLSDRILLHNTASIPQFQEQVDAPAAKLMVLPHPSYQGIYDNVEDSVDTKTAAHAADLLVFGRIKTYKNAHSLIGELDENFLKRHALRLRISGEASEKDRYLAKLRTLATGRSALIDPRRVPDEEVAPLLRSVTAVLIPYERVFTSGVAVLCLTLGVPAIAARTPQMLELFPEMAHELLFDADSPDDLRRAIVVLRGWDNEHRQRYLAAARERASAISPKTVSIRLGALYDELLDI